MKIPAVIKRAYFSKFVAILNVLLIFSAQKDNTKANIKTGSPVPIPYNISTKGLPWLCIKFEKKNAALTGHNIIANKNPIAKEPKNPALLSLSCVFSFNLKSHRNQEDYTLLEVLSAYLL